MSYLQFAPWIRSVKRETLKLIETFLDKAEDQPQIGKQFVPPMMDPVLGDYARNLPDARESEVLSLFATIINKYAIIFSFVVLRLFLFFSREKQIFFLVVANVNVLLYYMCSTWCQYAFFFQWEKQHLMNLSPFPHFFPFPSKRTR